MSWYGNVYSGGGNLYYYPNGQDDRSSRVYIDNWSPSVVESAYNQMVTNKDDSKNWNSDYNKIKGLHNSVQAMRRQEELQMAQIGAYEKMAEASMRDVPALEPLKQAGDAQQTAKAETNKRQQQRASLYSQFRRSGYSQGQKSTTLGG